jgi:hypothetical protein
MAGEGPTYGGRTPERLNDGIILLRDMEVELAILPERDTGVHRSESTVRRKKSISIITARVDLANSVFAIYRVDNNDRVLPPAQTMM